MIATHAFTFDGLYSGPVQDSIRSIPDEIRWQLNRLDGRDFYALSMWSIPSGKGLDQVPADYQYEYIQTAGSSERLTVEIRENVGDVPIQYVIGRDPKGESQGWQIINWAEHEVPVLDNEVMTADEAFEAFWAYYQGQPLPAGFVRRPR